MGMYVVEKMLKNGIFSTELGHSSNKLSSGRCRNDRAPHIRHRLPHPRERGFHEGYEKLLATRCVIELCNFKGLEVKHGQSDYRVLRQTCRVFKQGIENKCGYRVLRQGSANWSGKSGAVF